MAKKKNIDAAESEERFETLVEAVENALRELEGGELPLEDALKRYEQGVTALRKCYGILKQAEAKVMLLTRQNGTPETKPFDEGEDEDSGEEPTVNAPKLF